MVRADSHRVRGSCRLGDTTEMTMFRSVLLAGLGLAVAGLATLQPASAQYYGGGHERGWDDGGARRGYGRDDRREFDRRDGYRRDGYDRRDYGRRESYGDRRPANTMAGMTIEEQKRAIKNQREAHKKAFKKGLLFNR